jgi:hypothetical protein
MQEEQTPLRNTGRESHFSIQMLSVIIIALVIIGLDAVGNMKTPYSFASSANVDVSVLSAQNKITIDGVSTDQNFGYLIMREPCDINGDGYDDLAILSRN